MADKAFRSTGGGDIHKASCDNKGQQSCARKRNIQSRQIDNTRFFMTGDEDMRGKGSYNTEIVEGNGVVITVRVVDRYDPLL